jgi:hypothetical protein
MTWKLSWPKYSERYNWFMSSLVNDVIKKEVAIIHCPQKVRHYWGHFYD